MSALPSPDLDALEARATAASPGFRRVLPRHTIEAKADGPFAGLWIEVADLTNGDVQILRRSLHVFDLYRLMAPMILAWNVEAPVWGEVEEPQTEWGGVTVPKRSVPAIVGWERLPPPAEAGPDVFLRVPDAETLQWIVRRLRGHGEELDDAALKALTRPGSGTAGASDASAPSPTAASSSTGSRRGRRSSTTPSGGT